MAASVATWLPFAGRPARRSAAAGAPADQDGKAGRFRALALPHIDEVYTLARYLLRHEADAEDAVQECYLRAYRYFDGFTGSGVKPWLFTILRNVCRARRGADRGLVFGDDSADPEGAGDAVPLWSEAADTPEDAALRRADSAALHDLVAGLPEPFREVLVLRELNDLSYREIAEVVDAPIGTVMSRLARARTMLREAWTAAEDGRAP